MHQQQDGSPTHSICVDRKLQGLLPVIKKTIPCAQIVSFCAYDILEKKISKIKKAKKKISSDHFDEQFKIRRIDKHSYVRICIS